MSRETDKTICKEYSELLQGIFNSQNQQVEIKINSIKILLGTFAFIGILGFASIGLSNFWFICICTLLPFFSLFIIISNFFHDLVYKERLKLGFFSSAVKLEQKFSWLPEFHKSLLGEYKLQIIPIKHQIIFYFGCGMILVFLSMLFLFFLPIFPNILFKMIIGIIYMILLVVYYKFLFNHVKKTRDVFLSEIMHEKHLQSRTFKNLSQDFLEELHAIGKRFIEHFSDLKMRYKSIPIFILTALFIAIAYIIGSQESFSSTKNILMNEQSFIHEHLLYLISLITILSVIGIKLVRYLDINVSHEQIRSLFKCIIELEKQYKTSKPYEIISNTLYQKRFDPIFVDFFCYASFIIGIIFLGCSLLIAHWQDYHSFFSIIVSLMTIVSLFIWEIIDLIILVRKRIVFNK